MNPLLLVAMLTVGPEAPKARRVEACYVCTTGKHIFPSYLISTATVESSVPPEEPAEADDAEAKRGAADTDEEEMPEENAADEIPVYGDPDALIGVALEHVTAGSSVRVEITGDEFLRPSIWEGEIEEDADTVFVQPRNLWRYDELRKVTQQKPAIISIKVTVDDVELPEIHETVQVRSINDCPFFVVIDRQREDVLDITSTFAAYVNEGHPWIDGLLKEALKSVKEGDVIRSFDGYQSKDPEVVLKQVFAVWNALQRRGIRYSDVSTVPQAGEVISQHVRFLDDTIDAEQANCVDGTVLLASVLRKIGLDVHLVLVPGHCFLAFSDGQGKDAKLFGLETTMLGRDDLKSLGELKKLPAELRKKEFEASFATFAAALEAGGKQIKEHAEAFKSEEDPRCKMISIAEARQRGIMPLGSDRKKTDRR